ncbi:hypothetical protein BGZ98_008788 [Dissophora globulifera]|nr:hypothetical protein BGZ98_008788 [Dissophora globulifera]
MLSAARTPHHVQNSDGSSILLEQNNPVPAAPVLLIVSQMSSSINHVMDIDDSLVLPNDMSHCEQDSAPITSSAPSHTPSSLRTAVPKPPKIFWAKPYAFTAKKVDNRANNAIKQLKVAMAEANSTAGF